MTVSAWSGSEELLMMVGQGDDVSMIKTTVNRVCGPISGRSGGPAHRPTMLVLPVC
jgi:hypothetical protein